MCDFSSKYDGSDNVTLILDGVPLVVSKSFLAMHSPVFGSMFYKDFAESKLSQIPLKEVDYNEFVEALRVIYPSEAPVTAQNVRSLLILGDRFDMKILVKRCEQFLIGSAEIPQMQKILYAEKFCLENLRTQSLNGVVYLRNARPLLSMSDYQELGNDVKVELLERILNSN